jgi:hypothetical protein
MGEGIVSNNTGVRRTTRVAQDKHNQQEHTKSITNNNTTTPKKKIIGKRNEA